MTEERKVPKNIIKDLENIIGVKGAESIRTSVEQKVEQKMKEFGKIGIPPIYPTRFMYEQLSYKLLDQLKKAYTE